MYDLEVLADVHVDQQADAVLKKELLDKIKKAITMSIARTTHHTPTNHTLAHIRCKVIIIEHTVVAPLKILHMAYPKIQRP